MSWATEPVRPDDMPVLVTEDYAAETAAIADWLVERGLLRTSFEQLIEGVCHRLRAIDVPVWRMFASADTLHPRIRGMGCTWRDDQGIRSDVYIHRLDPPPGLPTSPLAVQAASTGFHSS